MYIPKHNEMNDSTAIEKFIQTHSFGIFTSLVDGEPFATHLPFLYDKKENRLYAHMAKANTQWRNLDGQTTLTVFSGAHAYVSPSWYTVGESVPTWNYLAVHVYGKSSLMTNAEELADLLDKTVRCYEPTSTLPRHAGESFYRNMMHAIVGFRIDITRIEGKEKLSQNRSTADQLGVIAELSKSQDHDARTIAKRMQERLAKN